MIQKKSYSLLLLLLLQLVLPGNAIAQSKKQAFEMGKEAVRLLQSGKTEEGMAQLRVARKYDPSNIFFTEQMALAYARQGDNEKVVEELASWMHTPEATALCFQLYGNAMDVTWSAEEAIRVYQAGLDRYPTSGALYMEWGIIEYSQSNDGKAIQKWLEGIEQEPMFSSNYYFLAKAWFNTGDLIPAMLMGETFLNLEPTTDRSREISRMLYDAWGQGLVTDKEKGVTVQFMQQETPSTSQVPADEASLSFAFNDLAKVSHPAAMRELSVKGLTWWRTVFSEMWQSLEAKKFPIWVLDLHDALIKKNFFEAYNYWLFMDAIPEEYDAWRVEHLEEVKEFEWWFNANYPEINKRNSLKSRWFISN